MEFSLIYFAHQVILVSLTLICIYTNHLVKFIGQKVITVIFIKKQGLLSRSQVFSTSMSSFDSQAGILRVGNVNCL